MFVRNFNCLSVFYENQVVGFFEKSLFIVVKKITFVPPLKNQGAFFYYITFKKDEQWIL